MSKKPKFKKGDIVIHKHSIERGVIDTDFHKLCKVTGEPKYRVIWEYRKYYQESYESDLELDVEKIRDNKLKSLGV